MKDPVTLLEVLQGKIEAVIELVQLDDDDTMPQQAVDLNQSFGEVEKVVNALVGKLESFQKACQDGQGLADRKSPGNKPRLKSADGILVLVAALLLVIGYFPSFSGNSFWGGSVVIVSVVSIAMIIFGATVRSDMTYHYRCLKFIRDRDVLPSRFYALFIIPAFLVAIWFGFGGMYADIAEMSRLDALYHSGVTITTLGYLPGLPQEIPAYAVSTVKWLMLLELGSGVLGIVAMLALLMNRISEF